MGNIASGNIKHCDYCYTPIPWCCGDLFGLVRTASQVLSWSARGVGEAPRREERVDEQWWRERDDDGARGGSTAE